MRLRAASLKDVAGPHEREALRPARGEHDGLDDGRGDRLVGRPLHDEIHPHAGRHVVFVHDDVRRRHRTQPPGALAVGADEPALRIVVRHSDDPKGPRRIRVANAEHDRQVDGLAPLLIEDVRIGRHVDRLPDERAHHLQRERIGRRQPLLNRRSVLGRRRAGSHKQEHESCCHPQSHRRPLF